MQHDFPQVLFTFKYLQYVSNEEFDLLHPKTVTTAKFLFLQETFDPI
jgi:hypothetical protein